MDKTLFYGELDLKIQFEQISEEELLCHFNEASSDFSPQTKKFWAVYAAKLSARGRFVTLRNEHNKLRGIIAFYMNMPPSSFISHVWIHSDFRGKGFCGKMLRFLHNALHDRGFSTVGLEVRVDNNSAIRTYNKEGYKIVRVTAGKMLMEKSL